MQCVGYDFTLKEEGTDLKEIMDHLGQWCKEWVFQLEEGDSGYRHYQGRVRLIKKRRPGEIAKIWQDILPGVHLSPTSNAAYQQREFSYVMKADTRINGPWKNTDLPKYMTKRLRKFLESTPYPWQQKIIDLAGEYDDRSIKVILDKGGSIGKSSLAEYLEYMDIAYDLPYMSTMEDIMQACMGLPPFKAYLIDMPKGLKKEKLASFYAGLECLKNGVMYDKRYSFKKRRIDCPQIFVFTNNMPDLNLLSIDRWQIYTINESRDLIEVPICRSALRASGPS